MDYLEYKGYRGSVEYCKDDDCLVGYEGATLAELRQDFMAAVDSYIEGCLADGVHPRKPFSGKLILRMSSDLHGRVAMAASASGTTINDFINRTLTACVANISF